MASTHVENGFPPHALVRPAAIVPLVKALACGPADDQFSGTLRVTGHPGGVFFLERGMITAVDSPGAPDVSTLLLRSGRIGEADWAAVVKAGSAQGRIGAELIARKLVGPAELQVICQMAALDGAFAIAVGRIDDCVLSDEPMGHWLPAEHGIERESLLREIERRLNAFARGSISVAPYQDRLGIARHAAGRLDDIAGSERREILQRVNGRRSARDIAFMLGRSVYAVTVQVSRMLSEGLVEITSRPTVVDASGDPSDSPLTLRARAAPVIQAAAETTGVGLPRRVRRASGISDVLRPPPTRLDGMAPTGHDRE